MSKQAYKGVSPSLTSSSISFHINGVLYTVHNGQFEFTTSLNEYIRDVAGHKGTKVMCREGGCGACVVTVTAFDPRLQKDKTFSINSCLCPLYSVDSWHIVTVEGIGNQREGFHPIQERIASYNGSQCGYCTPGFVMNMYGLLHDNQTPSEREVEGAFDGNICRCTGYRSILDAMKSFAADSSDSAAKTIDIEDLNKFTCCRSGTSCANGSRNGDATTGRPDNAPLAITNGNVKWFRPESLDALSVLLKKYKRDRVWMFFGNTSTGVYNDGPFNVYIDLHGIEELYRREVTNKVTIGANHTLSSLHKALGEIASENEGYKYFSALQEHILKIGNLPMRNAGSWAGNMMIKQAHNDFPSDLFVMMEAAGAHVEIFNALLDVTCDYPMLSVMTMDMTGKVIKALKLFKHDDNDHFRSFKIMPRSQNAHAYINAGFRFNLCPKTRRVIGKPAIVIGGINASFNHALKTEDFLKEKSLQDQTVVKEALALLRSEMKPSSDPVLASPEYRLGLAVNLFYKFLLGVNKDKVAGPLSSGGDKFIRPISKGEQDFETKDSEFPLKQPMTKVLAPIQASGEAQFVNDIPEQLGELHGAFVLSTQGNAGIDSIDASTALAMPGARQLFTSKDIVGENNFLTFTGKEEVFASERVHYVGQPIAMIVADTYSHAVAAAKAVQIKYKDVRPPIITIQDAIAKNSFAPCPFPDLIRGDPKGVMASAPHTVEGTVSMGHQYHFFMENPAALAVPCENSIQLYSTTQAADLAQMAVAEVLGKPINSVDVSVSRLGGGFGGKALRPFQSAAAVSIAATITGRPVRMNINLQDNMELMGKRQPMHATYKVAFDDNGKLLAIDTTVFHDCGYHVGEALLFTAVDIQPFIDGGYFCPNWKISVKLPLTNTAVNASCRAPSTLACGMIIETIVEHVAKAANKDAILLKELNLYKEGQLDHCDNKLKYCSLRRVWGELKASAEVDKRQKEIEQFNKNNQWRKRGIAMTPVKYGINYRDFVNFTTFVAIYKDGTVAVSGGGVEMGQGLNTKVIQAVAATLDVPVSFIKTKPSNTFISANNYGTFASIGSELCVLSAIECCKILSKRLAPFRKKSGEPWQKMILTCAMGGVDLTVKYTHQGGTTEHHKQKYFTYGVGVTEVELDILTGENEIRRVDITMDLGESLNPTIDIGQIEGATVMGLGYWLSEHIMLDEKTGKVLNNGTWEYKPPTTKDIPIDWRIKLLRDAPNPSGILNSKAVGEPPIVVSTVVAFAIKRAIEAAREDLNSDTSYFPIGTLPLTVEKRQQLCKVLPSNLTI